MRVTDFAGRLKILKDKHEEIERDREASEDTWCNVTLLLKLSTVGLNSQTVTAKSAKKGEDKFKCLWVKCPKAQCRLKNFRQVNTGCMKKKNKQIWANKKGRFSTWGSPDIHSFEMTRFDDVHSDGVGSGIITERHQQVTSSPLRKHTHTNKQRQEWLTPFSQTFVTSFWGVLVSHPTPVELSVLYVQPAPPLILSGLTFCFLSVCTTSCLPPPTCSCLVCLLPICN